MEQTEKTNRITGKSLFLQKQEEFLSLQEQAQAGDVTAQYNVGICHLYGQNTKVDYNKVCQYFEKAVQQGDKLAGLFLGYFHEVGVGRGVNYTQAINKYMTYSPSISEVDKTALWEKAKKLDENEIERNLSEIYNKAKTIGETILNIKGFCVYYPADNSFNFKWNDITRSEFKQPLEEYNKLVEEFKIYLDAYTSDADDEKYGYWIYIYEDILNLTYEICNALVGRDSLFCYLDKVGLPAIEKNKNLEFALGRCLIDDNDDTDNDYIISGLLLVAGHDDDPRWQNKVGLWYELRNENKDLVKAEFWYKKAAALKLPDAEVNIERLKGEKEYKLITDTTEGSSEDRLKIVKSIRGNEELRNKWLLSAASLGNENAIEQLSATIDIKDNCIYNKACDFEPSWKRIELEQSDCKKKVDVWKQIVDNNRKKHIEDERHRIKAAEEEARRKAAEEEERRRQEERRKAAEEEERRRQEERRKAAEEKKRRRQEELDALKKRLKKWLWILLTVLIACGVGGWWYMNNYSNNRNSQQVPETVADTIPNSNEVEEIDEDLSEYDMNYDGSYSMVGKVSKYGIYMVLDISDSDVDGYYYYDSQGSGNKVKLKGTIDNNGYLKLFKLSAKGEETGYFEGTFDGTTYSGKNVNYERNESLPFSVFVDSSVNMNTNEEEAENDFSEDDQVTQKRQRIDLSSDNDESQVNSSSAQASTSRANQSNTAWFVFGTKSELQEQGILQNGQVLRGNFNKNFFTMIDIRRNKEIKLYSKSAELLTKHPSSSYMLAPDANRQYVLEIIDPSLFWSTSEYLVILVK